MKILILSKKFPYPLREGEPIAITYLSRSLHECGCEVSLLAMNTSKHYYDVSGLPASYNQFKAIHTVNVNNHITIQGALKSLVLGRSYILSRFYSQEYADKLEQLLSAEEYDVVQLETIYLAHYIPVIRKNSNARIAMRAHNVEHEIWERYARNSALFLKKWYLRNQNSHLRKFEIEQIRHYDILVAITRRDLEVFRSLGYQNAGVVVPVGINLKDYQPDFQCFNKPPGIAFIGALDWMPNQEGVVWFLENVWPEIIQRYPGTEFHVAGKNTPDWLRRKATDNVFFHGEVEDAKAFLNKHALMVAPLFSGSGIKIKVLEGMALGRIVFTTPVGAEGIAAIHSKHLFVADSPEGFIQNLVACMDKQIELPETGNNAREFIRNHFDNIAIATELVRSYENLLAKA